MIEINLLKPSHAYATSEESSPFMFSLVIGIALLILTALVIAFFHWQITSEIDRLQREVQRLQQNYEALKPYLQQVKVLQAQKDEVQRRFEAIDALTRTRTLPGHVLMEFSRAIPELAWLNQLKVVPGAFEAQGFARNERAVTDLITNLNRSQYFTNVELKSWELPSGSEIGKFVISGTVVNPFAQQPAEETVSP